MSAAPNVIPIEPVSVYDWIKAATSQPSIPPTTNVHLNGYSNRPEVKEMIESLALVHKTSGAAAAKQLWEAQAPIYVPDILHTIQRRSRILHCSELGNIKPFTWLITDEIPDDALSVLYGASGVGKSFQSLDWAERVSRTKPVVYVIGEGKSGYRNRHEAWLKHHKLPHGKLFFVEEPINALKDDEVSNFIEDIQEIKPRLIIFDTLARCFGGGDENDTGTMSKFVDSMRRIQNAFHCAVLVVHHTGKSGNEERGNSALRAAADMMIRMDENEGSVRLVCSKTKDSSEFEPKLLRRLSIDLGNGQTSCVLLPANLVKDDRSTFSSNQLAVIELLADPTNERGTRTSDIKAILSMSASSFHNVASRLTKLGLIKKTGAYDPWILTEQGRQLAKRLGYLSSGSSSGGLNF